MKKAGAVVIVLMLLAVPASAQDTEPVSLEVRVEGIEGNLLQNVLLSLNIEKRKDHPLLTPSMIRRLHRSAPGEIRTALEPLGYYRPEIQADLESDGQRWTAVYRVDPGDPVRISRISVSVEGPGKGRPQTDEALDLFKLEEGDILDHSVYEDGKRLLLNAMRQEGYLDAQLPVKEVVVDPDRSTAEVSLELDTGPRFSFGRLTFEQDFLSEEYLRGFVTIDKGDPFRLSALLDLEKALTDTRHFQKVDVRAPREAATGLEVPVTVNLTPGPSQRFTTGIGYGTDTGPRGRVGWVNRRVNRKGHRWAVDLLVSAVTQEFTTSYSVPLKRPRTDHLDYSLGWTREKVEDIDRQTYLAGTSLTRLRGRLQETWFLNFEQEKFTAGADSGTTVLVIPGVSWTLVAAEDRIRTTRGYKGILELKGASRELFSDTSFAQTSLFLKGILPLSKNLRFLARTELGTTWVEDFSELPSSQRFFAGGDRSVRGYGYKSIGPEDSEGEVTGGKHLAVASAEIEFFLSRNWSVAAFMDSGSSFNEQPAAFETGAGMGIRWHTFLGPIRLDYARALTMEGEPWRIHLVLGPDL